MDEADGEGSGVFGFERVGFERGPLRPVDFTRTDIKTNIPATDMEKK